MVQNILEINEKLKTDRVGFIEGAEDGFRQVIKDVSARISEQECPIMLISGPSGSAKTTCALLFERYLDRLGCETHVLSLDNYFLTMTDAEKELLEQKKLDLESPERIDRDFLNSQLTDIINCKPVRLTKFDFGNSKRNETETVLKRKPGEIVILEGTHALNPDVITVPNTLKVYASVRTRLETRQGRLVQPEYIRLLRRMLRDKKYRGRSFLKTAQMFDSVQAGEEKYIIPFKKYADFQINTFMPYEVNVYRELILEGIRDEKLENTFPSLIKLLGEAEPVYTHEIGKHSLIREFIGDGLFEY